MEDVTCSFCGKNIRIYHPIIFHENGERECYRCYYVRGKRMDGMGGWDGTTEMDSVRGGLSVKRGAV